MGARRTAVCTMVVAALLLTGCTSPAAAPTSLAAATPSPSPTAITLEQVKAAYKRYSEVSDAVAADGGVRPERLKPYVTEAQYQRELATSRAQKKQGTRLRGSVKVRDARLQRATPLASSAYVCLDLSDVRVISAAGKDVTPPTRKDLQTVEVDFVFTASVLRIDQSRIWSGAEVC